MRNHDTSEVIDMTKAVIDLRKAVANLAEQATILTAEIERKMEYSTPVAFQSIERRVFHAVYQATGVTDTDLIGSSRKTHIINIRYVAMYLIKQNSRYTYAQIAKIFNYRHHTTILHAIRTAEGYIAINDDAFVQIYNSVLSEL